MIRYIVIDVDGTLTDGGIYYGDNGIEIKKFSTKDAAGFFAAKQVGIRVIVITGRESLVTLRRMNDLKADEIYQNVKDKFSFLRNYIINHNISKEEIGYIGDDLNDLASMQLTGYIACPADSCPEILAIADYVSKVNGGYGVVRDMIEHYLREKGMWEEVIKKIYGIGV